MPEAKGLGRKSLRRSLWQARLSDATPAAGLPPLSGLASVRLSEQDHASLPTGPCAVFRVTDGGLRGADHHESAIFYASGVMELAARLAEMASPHRPWRAPDEEGESKTALADYT